MQVTSQDMLACYDSKMIVRLSFDDGQQHFETELDESPVLNAALSAATGALETALSESQEIVDYIKASPDALRQVEGKLGGGMYGLPDKLYGIPIVVEDCTVVTSPKGAPRTVDFAFPTGTCAIVSRPGGLVGASGGPNFSTMVLFAKEEMTTESFDSPKDRYTQLSVTEDYVAELVAPVSGVLLTNLLSTTAA